MLLISLGSGKIGKDIDNVFILFVFPIFCNIAYTVGWIIEIFITRSLSYAPRMFKAALGITLFFVFLPMAIWIVLDIVDLIKKLA